MDEALRRAYRNFQSDGTKQAYHVYLQVAMRGEQPIHCYFCRNLVELNSLLVCDYDPGCQAAACQNCSTNSFACNDADCDARGCPDCEDDCPACDKKICPGDHNTTCSKCYTETCLECNAYCDDCGDTYCPNHMDFSTAICENCLEAGGGYRRNPDIDIRQLERNLVASGSQEDADRLMTAYQRVGRELDYLLLLDYYGPKGWDGKRLTEEQEERLQHLMWTSLVESAIESDKTGLIDVPLLRVAEKFIDREISSRCAYTVYLDVKGISNPNKEKEKSRYGSESDTIWDELEKAEVNCSYHDDGVCLFDEVDYLEYWEGYSIENEPWNNTRHYSPAYGTIKKSIDWDGTLESLGYIGGGNLTGIGFMYYHRNCAFDRDENDSSNQPPDTPSLPPAGTQDPNW